MNEWMIESMDQSTKQPINLELSKFLLTTLPSHYKDTNKPTLVIKVILLVHIRP